MALYPIPNCYILSEAGEVEPVPDLWRTDLSFGFTGERGK
jgi:hypothetical protein